NAGAKHSAAPSIPVQNGGSTHAAHYHTNSAFVGRAASGYLSPIMGAGVVRIGGIAAVYVAGRPWRYACSAAVDSVPILALGYYFGYPRTARVDFHWCFSRPG